VWRWRYRGRLPCAATAELAVAPFVAAPAGLGLANRLVTVAAALPASEVRKNLRRDHWLMKPQLMRRQYTTTPTCKFDVCYLRLMGGVTLLKRRQDRRTPKLGEEDAFGGAGFLWSRDGTTIAASLGLLASGSPVIRRRAP